MLVDGVGIDGVGNPGGEAPRIPQVGVVGLVPDRWDAPWQPRHHVLSRLAQWFHVVWVEPAREWRRISLSGSPSEYKEVVGLEKPRWLDIYTPEWWLPHFYKPHWLMRWSERQRLRRACQRLRARGCRYIVLYLWRPEYAGALDAIPHDMSCYHLDDEYSFSLIEQPTTKEEIRLLERVNQVFIHSPGLFEKKGFINSRTLLVPNGVDFDLFSKYVPEPEELSRIRSPRIGYVGYLKTHVDFRLMLQLGQEHPEWSFILVGPHGWLSVEDEALLSRLKALPNVHILGGKPGAVLPAYVQWMDVCIMPYKMNDYTKYIFPLKLHEYLASGRPVVGTPIRSLKQFEYAVGLATTVEEWSYEIKRALAPTAHAAEEVLLRRQVAHRHDWSVLVKRIAESIFQQLGKTAQPYPQKPSRQSSEVMFE